VDGRRDDREDLWFPPKQDNRVFRRGFDVPTRLQSIMTRSGCVRSTTQVLALLILACPACRLLGQLSSDSVRGDAEPPSEAAPDSGAEDEATPWVTALDAATDDETGDATISSSDSATSSEVGIGVDVDAAADLGTGTDSSTETASQPETTAATGTSTGTSTPSGTSLLTATGSQSSATTQLSTETDTASGSATASGTGSYTTSQTATPSATSTGTSTPSNTATPTATASQTATHTTTSTSTNTPSGTGTLTGTGSLTATDTPSGTGTTSATGTQTTTASATSSIPVSSVSLDKTTDQIGTGHTDQLAANILPTNATNLSVAWSTSDASVATVSSSGVVSAVAVGTAVITATTADGGKTATCTVAVVVLVIGVALNPSAATLGIGESVSLTATVTPANATNSSVNWSSNDTTVATIVATGSSAVVTTVGSGSAKIIVSTQDGNKTATCVVTVARSAQWVRAPASSTSSPTFAAVAVDGSGNVYVAGAISGTGTYAFGNSVTATGAYSGKNPLVVKYDPNGTAQWARTVSVGPGESAFNGLATDSTGNLFAVGTISGNGSYGFGNSVTVAAPYRLGSSLVLVKYDPSGTATWARSIVAGSSDSSYTAVAADPLGNLYAAGSISGSSSFALGNGKTVVGPTDNIESVLLVKYSADGTTQWGQTTISGTGASVFNAVAAARTGHLYAAGYVVGTLPVGWGNSVTTTGTGGMNALLIQYDASGTVQWARAAVGGGNDSDLAALAVNDADDVFVAGWISGNTTNDFGAGVVVAGANSTASSVLLLKYSSSGSAAWGKSLAGATGLSNFSSLALDQAGHLYAVGLLAGPGAYDFQDSIALANPSNGNEVLLASYNLAGKCQGAQTAAAGSSISGFSAVTADSAANIYAVGYIKGTSAVDFGNSVSVTGAYPGDYNAVLVKYR